MKCSKRRVTLSLAEQSVSELLEAYSQILNELKSRDVLRTFNSPTGDYAEWLFCKCFSWDQSPNSQKGFDALDQQGLRFQIKAIRLIGKSKSRQMSAIRDLSAFDALAGIVFDENFKVLRAAIIPANIVKECSRFTAHTNSYRFYIRDSVWGQEGVKDVTSLLLSTQGQSD